jgi:DNA-binding winged helix-turn-helix (wHTH) protein
MQTGVYCCERLSIGMPASVKIARFGPFEANLETAELRKQGLKVRLPEQAFQILAMLLKNPGEVVSRQELQDRLWPGQTYFDFQHGLNKAINRLRDALNDSAATPRFIETVARRGYRLIVPVTAGEPAVEARPAGASRLRLAILPFENLSGTPEHESVRSDITSMISYNCGLLGAEKKALSTTWLRGEQWWSVCNIGN